MKTFSICISIMLSTFALAQSKTVTERVPVTSQSRLNLDFAFANLITFKTWDKKEVYVEVEVMINEGEYNDIFTLSTSSNSETVFVEMDEEMWEKVDKKVWRNNCSWETSIDYFVYLPKEMVIKANTISGDYEFEYFGTPLSLKTISGAIDVTVPANSGLDFNAETISGEVYSDLEIEFPYGKEGLRQIVGQKIYGRVSNGGPQLKFETISGDIFLREKS